MFFKRISYAIFTLIFMPVQFSGADQNWPTSAGGYESHRYSENSTITKDNISELKKIWTFKGSDVFNSDTVQATPIFTGEKLVSVSLSGVLRAINPLDGSLLWSTQLLTPLGRRGLSYVSDQNGYDGFIFVASGDFVYKVREGDGVIDKKYQTGLSLLAPIIVKNELFVATLKEGVKSFDINTGEINWTLPLSKNGVTSRVWSGFSFDEISGYLFVVTSNPGGIVGVGRGSDDFSVSLLAIDSKSGGLEWQFKHIINDQWDLDLTAQPAIFGIPGSSRRAVLSASKTGDVIYLDVYTGKPIFDNSITTISALASDVPNVYLSNKQLNIAVPEAFGSTEIDLTKDFSHLDKINKEYTISKLRHARVGRFVPPSVNYDVVMFGIHGGADWPGFSYNSPTHSMIVPYNKEPFILRLFYQDLNFYYIKKAAIFFDDVISFLKGKLKVYVHNLKLFIGSNNTVEGVTIKSSDGGIHRWSQEEWVEKDIPRTIANKIYPYLPFSSNSKVYYSKCSSCHGNARQGDYQSELSGGGFYPPLVGLTLSDKWKKSDSARKLNKIHAIAGVDLKVEEEIYAQMMDYFDAFDKDLLASGKLDLTGFWQLLLDLDGLPATSPPWGGLAKVDLATGVKVWDVPLGMRKGSIGSGDINFGGVVSTDTQIAFVTGNPDEMAYAFELKEGTQVWSKKLPFSGSSPPMIFNYRGCDLVIFVATGGRFVGYEKNGDSITAFKLSSCNFRPS